MRSLERREGGFSLTEMMVAISVMGLVVAAAIPNLRSFREAQRIAGAAQQMASLCRAAQAMARSENHHVIVEYRTDDNVLAIIQDENNNGSVDGGERVIEHPVGDGLQLASTSFANDQLIFDSRGRATNGGTVLLQGRTGVQPKRLTIAAGTGHVTIRADNGT